MDVLREIEAATRRVGGRTVAAGPAHVVSLARSFDEPLADVWEACTDAKQIPIWFLPVFGELHVGGRYQLEGNAGGIVERCDPPRSFAATWEYGDDVSRLEVRFEIDGDGRSRLELEHISPVADGGHWAKYGPSAVGIGWDMALAGLADHLSGTRALNPAAAAAWMISREGRTFTTLSGGHWGEAAIAAGADPADARAAAERAVAAYIGD